MTTQDKNNGSHLRLPGEIAKLEKAVEFFKEQGDEVRLSQLVPQLDGAKDRLEHVLKALPFVEKLGLSHEVNTNSYTFNDALDTVAKYLHEAEHGVKSVYARAHKHLDGVNDGAHCCPVKVKAPADYAAEMIEDLGLKDQDLVDAGKALFGKV